MKEFIYFDTNYITSALAQINKGAILSYTNEISDSSKEVATNTNENSSKSNIGMKALLKFAAESNNLSSDENSYINIETAKEVMTKSFDDYSFDILYNHICDNQLIKTASYSDGNFIEINGDFKLVDFDFLTTLLDKNFTDFYIQSDVEKNNAQLNREQKRTANLKQFEEERKKFYATIKKTIETCKQVMPSNIILQMKDVLAPINPSFLRGEFKDISFKYNRIHLIARITRTFTYTNYNGVEILLNAVNHMLPSVLKEFNVEIKNGSFIATPIAIYIE